MKNIKRTRLVESSFLFLVFGFLMLFSPPPGKAQNISTGCHWRWRWKWVWVWEKEINVRTGRSELQYVFRERFVQVCVPTTIEPYLTTSNGPEKPTQSDSDKDSNNNILLEDPDDMFNAFLAGHPKNPPPPQGIDMYEIAPPPNDQKTKEPSNWVDDLLQGHRNPPLPDWDWGYPSPPNDQKDTEPLKTQAKQKQFDASTLVGTWDGEITENGYTQKIAWQINADGTSTAWITSIYGTYLLGRPGSKWRYTEGIIYGDASSATLTWIDRNHIMLTIIQNEAGLRDRGRTRHYYRRTN
jgi:hypothetical protein